MPMAGSNAEDGAGEIAAAPPAPAPGRLLRRIGWFTVAICATAGLMLALGFLWFIWRLPAEAVALDRDADGIVVLTGGASRITDAIELLAAGHGRRLLISGANDRICDTKEAEATTLVPTKPRIHMARTKSLGVIFCVTLLAVILMVGGVTGAQFGARAGQKISGERLRLGLGLLVLAVGIRFALQLVLLPEDLYTLRPLEGGL